MAESQSIEWKELWRDEYLKWICGFANAQGGVICIGKNDNGQVVGVTDSKKLLEDIPNKVRDVLGIMVDVNLMRESEKDYIEIVVVSSSYPVNYKGEYHYRSGSTKQLLKGAALTEFLTSKTGHNWDDVPIDRVRIEDLDKDSFDIFRIQSLKSQRMDEKDLKISDEQLLDSLGLLEGERLIRAAVLLFHRDPEKWMKGSYIKIGFFETDADLRYQDEIHGSLFQQAEKVIDLLFTKYLKADITYDNVTRVERYPFPKAGIREAIYNAIIHKNYASQIPIQISVYEDKLYIANDCIFPAGWTVETLLQKHRSKPYNPNIANGFFRAGFVETWGRGIEKICEACKTHGIANPKYTVYPEDIMLLFQSQSLKKEISKIPKSQNVPLDVPLDVPLEMELGDFDIKIKKLIDEKHDITRQEMADKIGVSTKSVQRSLKNLTDKNIIERVGGKRFGYWRIK